MRGNATSTGERTATSRAVTLACALAVLAAGTATLGVRAVFAAPKSALPAPTITTGPSGATSSPTARFTYSHSRPNVTFACALDGAAFAPCAASGITYDDLDDGPHSFAVVAQADGATSAAATRRWTIRTRTNFGISGVVQVPLAPGVSSPVNLTFTNPNPFAIIVTAVVVTVSDTTTRNGQPNPDCVGSVHVETQPLGTAVTVPKDAVRSLQDLGVDEADWPLVTMRDLPWNQDGCKGTTFHFSYEGTATK